MGSWFMFLVGYVLGGLTLIPAIAWVLWVRGTIDRSSRESSEDSVAEAASKGLNGDDDKERVGLGIGLDETVLEALKGRAHIPDVASGYFAVCREYVPGGINGKPPERITPTGATVSMESPSVYQAMYRSIFDRNKQIGPSIDGGQGKNKKTRNIFFVVLRLGHLMLYDDSEQLDVRHVISLAHYNVDIYAGGEPIPEGELWIKRNCIRLSQRTNLDQSNDSKLFYLFSDNCSEKEDFYHAMLRSQENHTGLSSCPPLPMKFDTSDLVKLVQQLHASEENLHTRWINALIGRLFLALYKTPEIKHAVWTKITKKIARVPKPALISNVNVHKIDMGSLPPFITNPKLKELTVDGDLTIEADVSYKGNFRLDVSAVARIDLGSRIKAREVTLILATILRKLEGHILLRIKPAPSNRVWVTFETPPKMELSLEPIVSSRQITYGVILRAIENRIREVVNETLVLPNWDDVPFCDTESQEFRGGIWEAGSSGKQTPEPGGASMMDDSLPEESGSELEVTVPDLSGIPPVDATKSTPTLNHRSTLSPRRLTKSTFDLSKESTGVSSSADPWGSTKPKAMRSGSFSRVASPIVDNQPASAATPNLEEQARQPDAVTTMKTTISKSPSASPSHSPVGSPQGLSSALRQGMPSSPRPRSDAEDTATNGGVGSHTSAKRFVPSSQKIHKITEPTESEHDSPSSIPSNSDFSKHMGRRPMLNQSLTTATAVAKKWLTPRRNSGTHVASEAAKHASVPSSGSDPSLEAIEADPSPPKVTENIHHRGPMGRGQPLPPPGTPLPLPPPLEKRSTWSLPAGSTLANLTRRKPVPAKQPKTPSLDDLTGPQTPSLMSPDTEQPSGSGHVHGGGQTTPRKGSNPKSISAIGPPPLPKRRQRLSVTDATTSSAEKVEMLVVEAPHQEASAPASPITIDVPQQDPDDIDIPTDEHETVFQDMELNDRPT